MYKYKQLVMLGAKKSSQSQMFLSMYYSSSVMIVKLPLFIVGGDTEPVEDEADVVAVYYTMYCFLLYVMYSLSIVSLLD